LYNFGRSGFATPAPSRNRAREEPLPAGRQRERLTVIHFQLSDWKFVEALATAGFPVAIIAQNAI
jgi:hypothetical protein